jgi:hypothetical protein
MIIGLIGHAGSGKDFTFELLQESGYAVHRRAWADPLREEIQEAVADGAYLPALWRKPYSREVRSLLQWWGTEFRRGQDPDYWIKKMKAELVPFAEGGPFEDEAVIITDTRYMNEVEALKEMGGLIVRIWAPENVRKERLGGELPPDHFSERALDKYPVAQTDIVLVSGNGTVTGMTPYDQGKWRGIIAKLSWTN